ncbi:hypothetical protein GGR56DRAFT_361985 [Xylariaceae sp. FL0804]|nr:hypothetical protein GGR56DRAFT_361985 [Xylariaceae sp. FL0804]
MADSRSLGKAAQRLARDQHHEFSSASHRHPMLTYPVTTSSNYEAIRYCHWCFGVRPLGLLYVYVSLVAGSRFRVDSGKDVIPFGPIRACHLLLLESKVPRPRRLTYLSIHLSSSLYPSKDEQREMRRPKGQKDYGHLAPASLVLLRPPPHPGGVGGKGDYRYYRIVRAPACALK